MIQHSFLRIVFLFVVGVSISRSTIGDDTWIASQLRELGGDVKINDGVVTEVSFRNSRDIGDQQWMAIGQLTGLKKLTAYGHAAGLNDSTVGYLASLQSLESLSVDGAQLSDNGLEKMAALKSLRSVAFFHLSFRKEGFTGKGFEAWSSLDKLERLTVAGMSMGDDGFAAIASIKNLRELRTWHTYRTQASHNLIAGMPNLNVLKLGQRLPGNGRPVCLNEDSLETIAKIATLEQLEISEAKFSVAGLSKLAALPKLKRLKIDRVELSGTEVDALRKQMPEVKVDFTAMTDDQRAKLIQYLK